MTEINFRVKSKASDGEPGDVPDELKEMSSDLMDDLKSTVSNRVEAMHALGDEDDDWSGYCSAAALQAAMGLLVWTVQCTAKEGHKGDLARSMADFLTKWADTEDKRDD